LACLGFWYPWGTCVQRSADVWEIIKGHPMFYTTKTSTGNEFGISDDGKTLRITPAKSNGCDLTAAQANELYQWLTAQKAKFAPPAPAPKA
jgi:hypothetical protein